MCKECPKSVGLLGALSERVPRAFVQMSLNELQKNSVCAQLNKGSLYQMILWARRSCSLVKISSVKHAHKICQHLFMYTPISMP